MLETGKTNHFVIDTPKSQRPSSATIGTQTDLSLSIGLEVPKWIPVIEHANPLIEQAKRLEGTIKGATSDLVEAIREQQRDIVLEMPQTVSTEPEDRSDSGESSGHNGDIDGQHNDDSSNYNSNDDGAQSDE